MDNVLPERLKSRNDFNEAKRLIDGIRTDMNKVEVRKEDKKNFNDLNRLITGISKMIQVVYQLFNSFGLNKEFLPLFSQKEPNQLRLPKYVKVSYDKF